MSDLESMKARLASLKKQSFAPSPEEAERLAVIADIQEQNERLDREREELLKKRADAERERLLSEAPNDGPYESVCFIEAEKLGLASIFVLKTFPPGAWAAYTRTLKPGKAFVDVDERRKLVFKSIAFPDVKNEANSKAVHATLDKFTSLLTVLYNVADELSGCSAEVTRPKSRG